VNPPLRTVADGRNGLYGPPGQFPASTYQNSHYFRDILFSPGDDPTDSDGDGLPDRWESDYGCDPTDPFDAHDDTDQDGFRNGAEYLAGTHPRDPASRLQIDSIVTAPNRRVVISFQAQRKRAYQLQSATVITNRVWSTTLNVSADPVANRVIRYTNAANLTQRYFRVITSGP
jgi:hypothetical protein